MSNGVASGGQTENLGVHEYFIIQIKPRKQNGVVTGVASRPFGVAMIILGLPHLDPPLLP